MQRGKLRLSSIECYVQSAKSIVKRNSKYVQIAVTIIAIIAALLFFVFNGEKSSNMDKKQAPSISSLKEPHSSKDASKSINTKSKTVTKNKSKNKARKSSDYDELIIVDISGEINKPGVYKLRPGTRVYELIEQAGGLSEMANADVINRASTVSDGQKIVIPSKASTGQDIKQSGDADCSSNASGLVNINQADQKQLESIAGIGPSMAKRIIEYRNSNGFFGSIDELMNVKGIGAKKFDKIKTYVTI